MSELNIMMQGVQFVLAVLVGANVWMLFGVFIIKMFDNVTELTYSQLITASLSWPVFLLASLFDYIKNRKE